MSCLEKQKTVAIIINTSWNIYNFRLGLLCALQRKGYRVVAIAPVDRYSAKLSAYDIEHHAITMNNKGTNPFEDIKLFFSYVKILRHLSPDVILSYTIKPNIYATWAAGVLKIPVIANISGLGTVFLNDSFSSKVARFLYRVALKIPHKVFFQNREDKEIFLHKSLVNQKQAEVIAGSGIDTKKFSPLEGVQKSSKGVRFLFVGRVLKDKGILEYIEAAKRLKGYLGCHFYILGACDVQNPTAIKREELRVWEDEGVVTYLGVSDDVDSVMQQYDCVVLPSYREGLSRVLLEAASMQKPIITTNIAGCKEVVDDGENGYLCCVKDVESLVLQIQRMIHLTQEEREAMGKKGRQKVEEHFSESRVIDAYVKTLEEIFSQEA